MSRRIELLVEQSSAFNDEVDAGVLLFHQSLIGYRRTLHTSLPHDGYGLFWSLPWWWTEVR